ncbi:MAG: TMEM175 family protein [Burkholderiales bacterium]
MLDPLPLPKARLEALTDGIFAVTMTLLVLDLKLAERMPAHSSHVLADLFELAQQVDDYVISFIVLCLYWLAHLRVIRRVRDVDATFTWFNLAFLLFTTFVPPLTSWVGHAPTEPIAAVVYGANLLLILLFETLMWRRAARRLYNESVTDPAALWVQIRRRSVIAAAIILAGIGAALIEIGSGAEVAYASYVYLLMIGVGIVRPQVRGKHLRAHRLD